MSDDEPLTMVQEACWEAAHPNAGMAIGILPGDKNLVALGSSGFGIMRIHHPRARPGANAENHAFSIDR
jgi:hypothetical protein